MLKVLLFTAPWCQACKVILPQIKSLLNEYLIDYDEYNVNEAENYTISVKYSVTSLPHIVILKNGEEIYKASGSILASDVENVIKND